MPRATTASQIADIIKVDGQSVMFPLASFVYPVFVNLDLAKAAGVDDDADQPHRVRRSREEDDQRRQERVSAGCCRCRCETPNGIQNDVMSWVWASGAIDAEGRQARPRERGRRRHARVHQVAERRGRHLARHLRQEGAGQGRGVRQRPRRDDGRLARPHQPDPRAQPEPERSASPRCRRSTATPASAACPTPRGASASARAASTRRRPGSSSST